MKLLVTGAAGRIGSRFVSEHAGDYEFILTDIRMPVVDLGYPVVLGNLADTEFTRSLMKDVDVVLHLAGEPSMAVGWSDLIGPNILGAINVFETAFDAGVKQLVYASSVNVVTGYPRDYPVPTELPHRPLTRYGVTKCFGETLCQLYSAKGMSCTALRFGWVATAKDLTRHLTDDQRRIFVSCEDVLQCIRLALVTPRDLGYREFNVLSDNEQMRLDIQRTIAELGYCPGRGARASKDPAEA